MKRVSNCEDRVDGGCLRRGWTILFQRQLDYVVVDNRANSLTKQQRRTRWIRQQHAESLICLRILVATNVDRQRKRRRTGIEREGTRSAFVVRALSTASHAAKRAEVARSIVTT